MVNISKLTKKRLGELLQDEGLIKEEQIAEALKKQKETGELLGEVLLRLGYIGEVDIARCIAKQFGMPFILASDYDIDPVMTTIIPAAQMQENQLVLLDKIGSVVIVAFSGIPNEKVFDDLEARAGCQIQLYVTTAPEVARAILRFDKNGPKK